MKLKKSEKLVVLLIYTRQYFRFKDSELKITERLNPDYSR